MKKLILIALIPITLTALLVVGCKKKPNNNNNDNSFDRGALLTNYADGYIIPAYADMVAKLTILKTNIDDFAAAPDSAKLVAAQAAWKDAYMTWQGVDLLEFGPDVSISLRSYINTYPATVSKVEANITSGSYELEQFGNKDAQGFPALDYLLNGIGPTNQHILALYITGGDMAKRKKYMQDVAAKMLAKVTTVQTAWNTYRATFVANTSTDAGSSISVMTNAFVLYYERYLRSGKIGLPVGAMSGVAAPELTEAYYTPTLSKELALAAIKNVRKFYEGIGYSSGTDGMGFYDYLKAVGTKDTDGKLMADVIIKELDDVKNGLGALTPTIKEGVTSHRPDMLNIYQEMMEVVPLFKVDMVSAFGISITYTDNDGD